MPRYPVPTSLPVSVENGTVYLQSVVQDPPSSSSCTGLAIIAHPLGRLGGSLDDPVVTRLSSLLLSHYNLRVVRFNSRGVGKSTGSASWTGQSECRDFEELVERCLDNFCFDFPDAERCQLVIAGYSAGSLYGSTVKVGPQLYDRKQFRHGLKPRYIFVSFPAGVRWALSFFSSSAYDEALRLLLTSSTDAESLRSQTPSSSPLTSPISPTIPDIGLAPTVMPTSAESAPAKSVALPIASHVLAVYGDADQFTGASTYSTWTAKWSLVAPPPPSSTPSTSTSLSLPQRSTSARSTFHHTLVPGADHFYGTRQAIQGLEDAVTTWLDSLKD
ncbi:hypothetical protein BCV70DRAFT_84581 [Testicularia cyperi]|uniref:Serine aminopeptidase S33 domain-containing protein n=1 Tax=Testicularia cyperi TaxID=1882483 RepID=A0A317XRM9_9BASI|nr:hypothetical protein BCV70DRAFT_84581 [Testicularia cyperi]